MVTSVRSNKFVAHTATGSSVVLQTVTLSKTDRQE